MPREMRRILFNEDELTDALRAFLEHRRQAFDGVSLLRCGAVTGDPPEVEIIVRDRSAQKQTQTLCSHHLAAALINYCVAHRIPMPRDSTKSVKRVTGGVALDMLIGGEAPAPNKAAGVAG